MENKKMKAALGALAVLSASAIGASALAESQDLSSGWTVAEGTEKGCKGKEGGCGGAEGGCGGKEGGCGTATKKKGASAARRSRARHAPRTEQTRPAATPAADSEHH